MIIALTGMAGATGLPVFCRSLSQVVPVSSAGPTGSRQRNLENRFFSGSDRKKDYGISCSSFRDSGACTIAVWDGGEAKIMTIEENAGNI